MLTRAAPESAYVHDWSSISIHPLDRMSIHVRPGDKMSRRDRSVRMALMLPLLMSNIALADPTPPAKDPFATAPVFRLIPLPSRYPALSQPSNHD